MSINAGMFSSKTDLWETPQDFFDTLNAEFHFEIDVCALPTNAKCAIFYTPEEPRSMAECLTKPPVRFSAIDCPRCGCQIVLAIHRRRRRGVSGYRASLA